MAKQVSNGRLRAPAISNLTLAKAEASVVNPQAVDYYIFNADSSYVVVAGDDQAPEILMYGEDGEIDLDNIPPAMQWLLNKYKYQIDGLKAGTMKANGYTPKAVTAVAPMVTANWDQSSPYNNQCPTSGSRRAVTGCPATSLAMCYYKWKWPKTFPACDAISSSSSGGLSVSAISSREADWGNIIDEYTGPSNYSSTSAQKDAVAWLMRYAGQSIPDYMYGTDASGATDPEILQGAKNMGYTDARLLTLTSGYAGYNQNYTDAVWNNYMMAELQAGRPIEYLASDPSAGGHAFNVFGCDANGKYYVNWGWSGSGNGYCTLHNFTATVGSTGQSGSYVFNYGEAMIIGLEPPAGALGPHLSINSNSVNFTAAGQQKIIALTGSNLTNDVTVTLTDPSDAFSLSVAGQTITSNAAMRKSTGSVTIPAASISESTPVNIIVALNAGVESNTTGTVTLASNGAETVTVTLNATVEVETGGTASDAYLNIAKYSTIDDAGWRGGYFNNLYKYAEDTNNGVAWLTLPVYGAWASWNYQKSNGQANGNGPQRWITSASISGQVNGAATWSATDIYKGSSAYFTSNNPAAKYFGNTQAGATTQRTITFNVKNVTGIKLYGKNNSSGSSVGSSRVCTINVYKCNLSEDGTTVTPTGNAVKTVSGGTGTSSTINLSITDLDDNEIYQVVVSTTRTRLYEIGFCTPLAIPKTPVIVDVDPASTTAEVTWASGDYNDSWNLRYRPYVEPEMESISWTFPIGDDGYVVTDGWSSLDYDGDGNSWGLMATDGDDNTDPTDACWYSASYASGAALTPDNWLISPEITFGGQISFYAWGVDPDWAAEVFNVLVAPSDAIEGNSVNVGEFVSITPDVTVNGTKTKYTFDLSAYEGTGYVVIQHHNVTDQFRIAIDDITVAYPSSNGSGQPEWIYAYDVTSPYTITGLTPITTYEVQVQGANATYGTSGWTASTLFTTTNGVGIPTIVSADPTATTSDITWTAGENNLDWNLRYRPYVDATVESILWDFPNDDDILDQQLEGWSIYDADEDGNNWGLWYYDDAQTDLCWGSESRDVSDSSYPALTPDNYLISPDVTLGGTLKFKAWNANASYLDNLGVYLAINETEEMVQLGYITPPTTETEYEYDLSGYSGTGYFIFRHYNSDGKLVIFLDDIEVTYPSAQPSEWTYVYSEESPYTITGLTQETTYEVQAQGVNGDYTSDWSASTLFTTLAEIDLANLVTTGIVNKKYQIEDGDLLAVYMSEDGRTLFCKDNNHFASKVEKADDQTDYLLEKTKDGTIGLLREDYDQSNWVALTLDRNITAGFNTTNLVGCYLNRVVGTVANTTNPLVVLSAMPNKGNEATTPYMNECNVFIPSNFTGSTSQEASGINFFFMTPKPFEVAKVTWALWNGTCFTEIPKSARTDVNGATVNPYDLHGAFTMDSQYLLQTPSLTVGDAYEFVAAIQRNNVTPSGAPRTIKDDTPTGAYTVHALSTPSRIGTANGGTVTGILDVNVNGKEVKEVRYIDVTGRVSKTPWHGVNIVETLYKDGSKSSKKVRF